MIIVKFKQVVVKIFFPQQFIYFHLEDGRFVMLDGPTGKQHDDKNALTRTNTSVLVGKYMIQHSHLCSVVFSSSSNTSVLI